MNTYLERGVGWRERQRQTDRQTETERQRQRDTERERDRDRERHRETERAICRDQSVQMKINTARTNGARDVFIPTTDPNYNTCFFARLLVLLFTTTGKGLAVAVVTSRLDNKFYL